MSFAEPEDFRRGNYIIDHWRGNLGLAQAYWLNGAMVSSVLNIVTIAIVAEMKSSDLSIAASSRIAIAMTIFSLAVSIWAIVGIWRSASRHAQRGGSEGWALLAKAMVALGVLGLISQASRLGDWTSETLSLALGSDPIGESAGLMARGSVLELEGPLTSGFAVQFTDALSDNGIDTVRLTSGGGRLLEARAMAREVESRGLRTIANIECSSACTIAFLAGNERLLDGGTRIGFHSPTYPGLSAQELAEMKSDLREAYRSFGLSSSFIARVMETSSDDMWYPELDILIAENIITGVTANFVEADNRQTAQQNSTTGPQTIDEITTLVSTEAEGQTLTFTYRLLLDEHELARNFDKVMENGLQADVCANRFASYIFAAGGVYRFVYRDQQNRLIAEIPIQSCN